MDGGQVSGGSYSREFKAGSQLLSHGVQSSGEDEVGFEDTSTNEASGFGTGNSGGGTMVQLSEEEEVRGGRDTQAFSDASLHSSHVGSPLRRR